MIKTLPLDLLYLSFLVLLSCGIGKKIVAALGLRFGLGLGWVFSMGLGLTFLSYLTFTLAFFGFLYRFIFIGFFVVLYSLTFGEIKSFLAQLGPLWAGIRSKISIRFEGLLLVLFFVAVLCNLVFNYSSPTQAREMLYDLTLPKLYLQAHRLIDVPFQKESYYPLQIQMLYLLAMCTKGVLLAKLIHYFLGILSAALVFCLAKILFGEREAFFAMIFFYLMPLTASLSGAANVDFGTLFFGLAAVTAFCLWVREKSLSHLLLSGFFAGVCLGTEVTGVSVLASLMILTFVQRVRFFRGGVLAAVQKCIVVGLLGLAGFSPWAIRNVYFTGNPVAPFSVPLFGWKGRETAQHEISDLKVMRQSGTVRDHLRGAHNILFGDFIFGGGPLLFAFLLPAFYRERDRESFYLVLSAAALNFILLYLILPYPHRFYEIRFYIVSAALLSILAGVGLEFCFSWLGSRRLLQVLVLAGLVFPGLTFTLLFAAKRVPLFLGRISEDAYLKSKLPFWDVVKFANENLSQNSRVALVGSSDANPYYWNALTITPYPSLLKEKDLDAVIGWMGSNRITHVLIFKNFYRRDLATGIFLNAEHPEENLYWDLDRLRASHFVQIYEDSDVTLYRVEYLDDSNKV